MTLIGILLALALERLLGHLPVFGEPVLLRWWFVDMQRVLRWSTYWRSFAAPLLPLLVAVAAVAATRDALDQVLLRLSFDALVLFLALGPRDLADDLHRLLKARDAGDQESADTLMKSLLRGPERRQSRRSLLGALFVQSHERVFGVLLWFFLLGPVGATLYRLGSRMPRFFHETQTGSQAENVATTLHAALAWLPVRITALIYAMSGSTDSAFAGWRNARVIQNIDWRQRTWATLAETGCGSLAEESDDGGPAVPSTLDDCLREVLALQGRGLLILLAVLAVFTAGGRVA